MSAYMLLCNFTDQGVGTIKDAAKRGKAAREMAALHRTLIPFLTLDRAVSIPLRQKLWIFADPDTLRPSGESVEWIGGQGDIPCCAIA